MAAFGAALKKGGLWPLLAGNRMHAAPPCNISAEDVAKGLAIIDEALSVADAHMA
jgi:taurine--2-oxoglutarate transaminase